MVQRGLIHIYTGSGKGKTSAALGLCFRAAGWGIRSAFIQFMKAQETGEIYAAEKFREFMIFEQYGSTRFIMKKNSPEQIEHSEAAVKGLARTEEILSGNRFSIVVLDEIISLPQFGIIPESRIIELIKLKPEPVELILTGRGASEELIRYADLVTEMKEVKHYFSSGIIARKGIEY